MSHSSNLTRSLKQLSCCSSPSDAFFKSSRLNSLGDGTAWVSARSNTVLFLLSDCHPDNHNFGELMFVLSDFRSSWTVSRFALCYCTNYRVLGTHFALSLALISLCDRLSSLRRFQSSKIKLWGVPSFWIPLDSSLESCTLLSSYFEEWGIWLFCGISVPQDFAKSSRRFVQSSAEKPQIKNRGFFKKRKYV